MRLWTWITERPGGVVQRGDEATTEVGGLQRTPRCRRVAAEVGDLPWVVGADRPAAATFGPHRVRERIERRTGRWVGAADTGEDVAGGLDGRQVGLEVDLRIGVVVAAVVVPSVPAVVTTSRAGRLPEERTRSVAAAVGVRGLVREPVEVNVGSDTAGDRRAGEAWEFLTVGITGRVRRFEVTGLQRGRDIDGVCRPTRPGNGFDPLGRAGGGVHRVVVVRRPVAGDPCRVPQDVPETVVRAGDHEPGLSGGQVVDPVEEAVRGVADGDPQL